MTRPTSLEAQGAARRLSFGIGAFAWKSACVCIYTYIYIYIYMLVILHYKPPLHVFHMFYCLILFFIDILANLSRSP